MILKAKFKLDILTMSNELDNYKRDINSNAQFILTRSILEKNCIVLGAQVEIMELIGYFANVNQIILESVSEVL